MKLAKTCWVLGPWSIRFVTLAFGKDAHFWTFLDPPKIDFWTPKTWFPGFGFWGSPGGPDFGFLGVAGGSDFWGGPEFWISGGSGEDFLNEYLGILGVKQESGGEPTMPRNLPGGGSYGRWGRTGSLKIAGILGSPRPVLGCSKQCNKSLLHLCKTIEAPLLRLPKRRP